MALRASIEMNLHGYSLALMDMHMAMPVKLKGLDRQRNIRRRVPILAILGFVRFVQSLFRLADKDQQLLLAFSYDFRPHKDVPEDFVRARHSNSGFRALAVDE